MSTCNNCNGTGKVYKRLGPDICPTCNGGPTRKEVAFTRLYNIDPTTSLSRCKPLILAASREGVTIEEISRATDFSVFELRELMNAQYDSSR